MRSRASKLSFRSPLHQLALCRSNGCRAPRSLPHLDPLGLNRLDDVGTNGGGSANGPGLGPGQSVSGFSLATDSFPETAFQGMC